MGSLAIGAFYRTARAFLPDQAVAGNTRSPCGVWSHLVALRPVLSAASRLHRDTENIDGRPHGGSARMADDIAENVAGLLCYSLGWITGLVFLLIDKRPFVRFHAAQSLVIFGGLHILYYILVSIFLVGIGAVAGGFGLVFLLFGAVRVLAVVLWIVLMVKAYQGERFKVPFAADLAENIAGRVAQKP